ncbi:MAG: ABC transporter ATP-binding protein [Luteimonas sp.]
MSCNDVAIEVRGLSKDYLIFDKPSYRLWQMLFRGWRKFYRAHNVLRDVSFCVQRGETVGLIGRNGSGKSTLLGLICGTLPPSAGSATAFGRVAALLELGAGFNPELTGLDNIELCAQIYGLTDEQLAARRPSIVEFAGIGDYITQPVKTYSSGMFTRLAFSVVAHVDADILVVDEALAVGDAYFVQKCMRFLENFKSNGGTLLFVSHDMGTVSSLCDRAIWIRDGSIAMDAAPKDVANEYLADIYNTQQGEGLAPPAVPALPDKATGSRSDPVDLRHELFLRSTARNDIEIFKFTPGHDFGLGGAHIESAALYDDHGRALSWAIGGELVRLEVHIRAQAALSAPIIGFVVKDRQGQPLFGDNTYLPYIDRPVSVEQDENLTAAFAFRMPILAYGTYSISVAIADGTQSNHVIHQWLHDAIILSSHSTSLSTGLIGIPMHNIELQRLPRIAASNP